MATYTKEQVSRYLEYAGLDPTLQNEAPSVTQLTRLVAHQLAAVPFESLGLHYSPTRRLSLDVEDLYGKIVGHGRGGYCMENNAFFGAILRSLGYAVFAAGGRVSDATAGRPGGGFTGL